MTKKTIERGAAVRFTSKTHKGRGIVSRRYARRTGPWVTVKTDDHPKGKVTVRESQVRVL